MSDKQYSAPKRTTMARKGPHNDIILFLLKLRELAEEQLAIERVKLTQETEALMTEEQVKLSVEKTEYHARRRAELY